MRCRIGPDGGKRDQPDGDGDGQDGRRFSSAACGDRRKSHEFPQQRRRLRPRRQDRQAARARWGFSRPIQRRLVVLISAGPASRRDPRAVCIRSRSPSRAATWSAVTPARSARFTSAPLSSSSFTASSESLGSIDRYANLRAHGRSGAHRFQQGQVAAPGGIPVAGIQPLRRRGHPVRIGAGRRAAAASPRDPRLPPLAEAASCR